MTSTATLHPRLKAQLERVPQIAVDAAAGAMEAGAEEIVQVMRSRVPEVSGDLRDSINWTWGDAPAGSLVIDEIRSGQNRGMQFATLKITIYVGEWYAHFVEFGTAPGVRGQRQNPRNSDHKQSRRGRKIYRTHPGTVAQPFFFNTWREMRAKFKRKIAAAVRRAIKESING